MSIFHHKGVLVGSDETWATHEYYPDHWEDENTCGRFRFIIDTLARDGEPTCEFLERIDSLSLGFNRKDEVIVAALMHHIRRYLRAEGVLPETVHHVA